MTVTSGGEFAGAGITLTVIEALLDTPNESVAVRVSVLVPAVLNTVKSLHADIGNCVSDVSESVHSNELHPRLPKPVGSDA